MNVNQEAMETSSQQDLERKMAGLKNEVQVQIMLLFVIMLNFVYTRNELFTFFFLCTFWIVVYGPYNDMPGRATRWVWF